MRAVVFIFLGIVCAGITPPGFPQTAAGTESRDYFREDDWQASGWRVTGLDGNHRMACDPTGQRCVCLEPLPCGGDRPCANFEENVSAFRAALRDKGKGRRVSCDRAEIGQCGNFRYFHFAGNIDRNETRWFDANDRLVAQRNRTDFPAYCGNRAELRLMGTLPRCAEMVQTELLCGTPKGPAPIAPAAWLSGSGGEAARHGRDDRPPVR